MKTDIVKYKCDMCGFEKQSKATIYEVNDAYMPKLSVELHLDGKIHTLGKFGDVCETCKNKLIDEFRSYYPMKKE